MIIFMLHLLGAFLIPYTISLIFMGIPLFCLELLIGQFSNSGPLTIWELNILFKGNQNNYRN